jgi:hypothetical protein
MRTPKIILLLGIGSLLTLGFTASAAETSASLSLSTLKSVPLAELPGKAATLVAAADAKSQIKTTVDVVKSAVGLNPAAAQAIVGSIAAGTPAAAATAAATAASLLPKQAAIIARAAAAAAPKQAGKIVEAVCRVVPDAYKSVAAAVAAAVPTAAREILAGVAAAIPQLQDAINNALASYKGAAPSVNQVLAPITNPATPSPVALTPVPKIGGPTSPYVPQPPTSPTLDPGANSQVPIGGNNYPNPTPVVVNQGG